jgi:hypothetical protein
MPFLAQLLIVNYLQRVGLACEKLGVSSGKLKEQVVVCALERQRVRESRPKKKLKIRLNQWFFKSILSS